MPPEFSVSCSLANGRYAGACFDLEDDAREFFNEAVQSGRYVNVQLYDAVDNLLDEWMVG